MNLCPLILVPESTNFVRFFQLVDIFNLKICAEMLLLYFPK